MLGQEHVCHDLAMGLHGQPNANILNLPRYSVCGRRGNSLPEFIDFGLWVWTILVANKAIGYFGESTQEVSRTVDLCLLAT